MAGKANHDSRKASHRFPELFSQLMKFFGVSAIALLADFAVFTALTSIGILPLMSNTVSGICGATITYFLASRYAFRAGTRWNTYLLFVVWTLLVIVVSSVFIQWLVQVTEWAPLWCKAVSAPLTFLVNFVFSKLLFRNDVLPSNSTTSQED